MQKSTCRARQGGAGAADLKAGIGVSAPSLERTPPNTSQLLQIPLQTSRKRPQAFGTVVCKGMWGSELGGVWTELRALQART